MSETGILILIAVIGLIADNYSTYMKNKKKLEYEKEYQAQYTKMIISNSGENDNGENKSVG